MFRRSSLANALVLSAPALFLAGCGKQEADPRTAPPLVRVAVAAPAAGNGRYFTGVVSARVQSDIGFRVAGKVTQRLVNVGQRVRREQILMRMDPTDLLLQTASQAQTVDAARAQAERAAADERRYRDLVAAGAVSASTYDQMKAASLSAQAQLRAAQAQARIAGNAADYAVLRSTADGVVVATLAEPGQVVAAGQPVVQVAEAGPREATVSLPESVRPAIGSVARATLYDGGSESAARLRQLSSSADPRTRTFEARYVLQGAAATAPLGATVRITLPGATGDAAIQVPLSALHDAGRGPGVWVVGARDRRVTWRPVRIAGLGEETAQISGGLNAGDRFVAMGAHLLHQGEEVRVADGRDGAL